MACSALVILLLILIVFSANAFVLRTRRLSPSLPPHPPRAGALFRERKCDLTGKRRNSKCLSISHSNHKTHKVQSINLHARTLWWEEAKKYVRLRLATSTLRTIAKVGLQAVAKKYGINLNRFSVSFGDKCKMTAATTASVVSIISTSPSSPHGGAARASAPMDSS